MPKVDFKAYQQDPSSPSQLDIIVSKYGPYLTLNDFTQCLKIKRTIAYGLLQANQIAHTRTSGKNGCYRISAVDIVKYIEKNVVKAVG